MNDTLLYFAIKYDGDFEKNVKCTSNKRTERSNENDGISKPNQI